LVYFMPNISTQSCSCVSPGSFSRPVTMPDEMAEAVATYTARAAEKMRRQRLATANLIVFVETGVPVATEPKVRFSETLRHGQLISLS